MTLLGVINYQITYSDISHTNSILYHVEVKGNKRIKESTDNSIVIVLFVNKLPNDSGESFD